MMDSKQEKSKIFKLFWSSRVGASSSTNMNFSNKKNETNEKDVHDIS